MLVYKTINLVNNKIYVGKDKKNNPNYYGSGTLFLKALKKYGRNNFKKEIIEYCDTLEKLNEREIYWIEKLNARDKNIGYNLLKGGEGGAVIGHKTSEETKEKIRKALSGKKHPKERRDNIAKNSKGISRNKDRKLSEKTKQKISEAQIGKIISNETKDKMSASRIKLLETEYGKWIEEYIKCENKNCNNIIHIKYREGKKQDNYFCSRSCSGKREKTLEEKNKISNSLRGKKQSQETINKRMKSMGDVWNKGKKGVQTMSKETKNKMSESQKKAQQNQKIGKCKYCGIEMRMSHLNRYHNENCKSKI